MALYQKEEQGLEQVCHVGGEGSQEPLLNASGSDHYRAAITKTVGSARNTAGTVGQNEDLGNRPRKLIQLIFDKGSKGIQRKKDSVSIQWCWISTYK